MPYRSEEWSRNSRFSCCMVLAASLARLSLAQDDHIKINNAHGIDSSRVESILNQSDNMSAWVEDDQDSNLGGDSSTALGSLVKRRQNIPPSDSFHMTSSRGVAPKNTSRWRKKPRLDLTRYPQHFQLSKEALKAETDRLSKNFLELSARFEQMKGTQ